MTRAIPLTVMKGGINRLRPKGGARSDVAYDLVNGYVTDAETVVVRPGTDRDTELPSTTRGLCFFQDSMHVFSHQEETVPEGYTNHVITHPTLPDETLDTIHFAQPFLGYLYVVAEFDNGDVFHFWLASVSVWEADHVYKAGDAVRATDDTGLIYKATRNGAANPVWQPRVQRAVNDVIEPTVYNDFKYTVVATEGDTPASGTVEPLWPTEDGAQITENADDNTVPPEIAFTPPDSVPSTVTDRYGRAT